MAHVAERVLMIEDDAALARLVAEYLRPLGFEASCAATAAEGLRRLAHEAFSAVLLDVMLPDLDGFEVCRRIRAHSDVPIVMLTARGQDEDRIVGLELGADDYLPKPFEPRELVARLQAVLRRGAAPDEERPVRLGALEVWWETRRVRLDGGALQLTTAEFELLRLLVKSRGRVLTRERILEATRGLDWEAFDRSVDVLVSRLRQKLGDDPRRPTFIRTVRGVGYRFVGGGDE
jgi:DNA-binding response OmpR family regulator